MQLATSATKGKYYTMQVQVFHLIDDKILLDFLICLIGVNEHQKINAYKF